MSDDYGQPPRIWIDVVRRARLSRTVKAVAVMLATYTDWQTGRDAYPGIARLAVDCGLNYNTVKDALALLRKIGLIDYDNPAGGRRRNYADAYRLVFRPDLSDQIEILTPAQQDRQIHAIREAKRGRMRPAEQAAIEPNAASETGRIDDDPESNAASGTGRSEANAASFTGRMRPAAQAATTHIPQPLATTNQNRIDVETASHRPRARPRDKPPDDPKCVHGFAATQRDDGTSTCALCRRGLHLIAV